MTFQIFFAINPLAVVTTALFMMGIATVWFSPIFLGIPYQRSLVQSNIVSRNAPQALFALIGTFTAFVLADTLCAFALTCASLAHVSLWALALGFFVFTLSLAALPAIWERRSLQYFLVQAGFGLVFVLGSLFILHYWPW